MAGGVGNLTVGLNLDYAAYTQGLTRAQVQAEQFSRQMKATFAGTFAAGIATSLIGELAALPGKFVDLVKGAIDAADHLNDLSKKTGIAADTLGGIGFAAKNAGGDLDSAAAGIGKLNKSIAEAAAGNKEAAGAFAAIGVAVKDAGGATKNADVVLKEVADKFASYADGPEKAALALKLFGKAGADMIPLLNDGGSALQANIDYFKRYSGVTIETAKAADEFNDTIGKIKLLTGAFATTLASELLPGLQAVADRFRESKEQAGTFHLVITAIKVVLETVSVLASDVAFVVEQLGKGIAAVGEASVKLAKGDFKGAKTIFSVYNEQAREARKSLDDFQARVLGVNEKIGGGRGTVNPAFAIPVKGAAPRLPVTGLAEDDPTKKLLEAQLKAIDGQIALEANLFQTRNRFLDFYNQQSLLSIQDYYAGRTAAAADALQKESALIDQGIALLQKDQRAPGRSKKDAAADEVKIQELIGRRTLLEQQSGEQTIFLSAAREKAYKDLADQLLGVNAQVLDLKENFAQAAAIRFDTQNDALSKTFTANGNEAGLQALATLRAAAISTAALNKASLDAGRTLSDLQLQEDRIALSVQTGALTSLEALAKEGDARRKMIPVYEAQVQALAAIAQASGNRADLDKLNQAQLALDRLKASADPLADSLNKTFGQDFNSSLDDFVTGTKSAADAFKSFAKSVLNDILKMGSKSITESIFGGSGGAGGLLSSLFSSGSAQGGVSGSSGLFSGIASLFSGFFADGGTIPPGRFGVVGERGPELAFGGTSGKTIAPMTGGTTQHINVSVQGAPGQSRDSALQQGAAIGLGIQRALARNS